MIDPSKGRDTLVLCLQFCKAGCRLDERFVVVILIVRETNKRKCLDWPRECLHEAGTGFPNISTNSVIKRQTEQNKNKAREMGNGQQGNGQMASQLVCPFSLTPVKKKYSAGHSYRYT